MLSAATELLRSGGPAAVTHAQVAARAGIGRATVYRHWPRADQLLAEAMITVPMPFFAIAATPDRSWFRHELMSLARQLEQDDVRAVTTTLANAALWDAKIDARRQQFAAILDGRLAAALATAQSRGAVVLSAPADAAAALLIGPLYYRSTIERRAVDTVLIDAVLEGVGAWR